MSESFSRDDSIRGKIISELLRTDEQLDKLFVWIVVFFDRMSRLQRVLQPIQMFLVLWSKCYCQSTVTIFSRTDIAISSDKSKPVGFLLSVNRGKECMVTCVSPLADRLFPACDLTSLQQAANGNTGDVKLFSKCRSCFTCLIATAHLCYLHICKLSHMCIVTQHLIYCQVDKPTEPVYTT